MNRYQNTLARGSTLPTTHRDRQRAAAAIDAVLLVGHSSSGKSPLGTLIEGRMGHRRRRFLHLDFGALLREVCAGRHPLRFSPAELEIVRSRMHGRLLDHGTFWAAERIVRWFLAERRVVPGRDVLVLNGLPRHIGQARDVSSLGIVVRLVVHLDCSAATAWQRKCLSEGGQGFEDRSARNDGARGIFLRRVRSFARRTLPLLAYYRGLGAAVVRVPVRTTTAPSAMLQAIRKALVRI